MEFNPQQIYLIAGATDLRSGIDGLLNASRK